MKKHAYWIVYLTQVGCDAALLTLHKDYSRSQRILTATSLVTNLALAAIYAQKAFCEADG